MDTVCPRYAAAGAADAIPAAGQSADSGLRLRAAELGVWCQQDGWRQGQCAMWPTAAWAWSVSRTGAGAECVVVWRSRGPVTDGRGRPAAEICRVTASAQWRLQLVCAPRG